MFIRTAIIEREFIDCAMDMLSETLVSSRDLQVSECTVRETIEFGHSFIKMRRGDFSSYDPLPQFLVDLCQYAIGKLEAAGEPPLPPATDFNNCILSVYQPGYKLEPHIDQNRKNAGDRGFYFGDVIIGIILRPDTQSRFYIHETSVKEELPACRKIFIDESIGTVFVLNGSNRSFFHGVAPVERSRISLIFRSTHFNQQAKLG